jgi:quercetin dioxygenase-like cupin family protein
MDPTSLAHAARTHLDRARAADHGRSAHTVHGGHDRALRQTIVALRAGTTLHEHASAREATLQVLAGRVRLTAVSVVLGASEGVAATGAGPAYSWQEDWDR